MADPAPSPFLAVPSAEWICANDLAFAIYDRFPVSPGHVLVITRRVVPTFFECTPEEQAALPEGCVLDVELEAKELLTPFLPAGRAAAEEAYRGMRAELGMLETTNEQLSAVILRKSAAS
ncbi:MAG: HIT family protein [Planctomycetaceae bacterium]